MCLLKFVTLNGRQSCPEASDTLGCIVLCKIVDLVCIARFVVEMGEVEAIGAICVEFQKAWCYYSVFQVDCLATNVAFSFEDESRLVRDDKVIVDKLAIEDIAAVGEESEPA
jgi:hypothetical protein